MGLCVIFLIGCLLSNANGLDLLSALNIVGVEHVRDAVSNSSISEECQQDLQEYFSTLTNLTKITESPWAMQMLDSSAKIPVGILTGTTVHIGQFDECLSVEHPSGSFKGQHCMVKANIKLGEPAPTFKGLDALQNVKDGGGDGIINDAVMPALSLGFCLPSSCSASDLNQIFNASEKLAGILTADDANCWTNEPRTLSSASWVFLSIVIILVTLVVLSTSYEVGQLLKSENANKLLSSFSLYSNTKSMIEIRDSSGEMACLHGIRTFSMMWVLLCHTYMKVLSGPATNLIDMTDIINSTNKIPIVNGFLSVDSFFFLSGLLVAFVFFRNIGRKGSFDAPTAYIHRFLRLTPPFMFMVFFSMTLLSDLDKGPLWSDLTSLEATACEKNWWSSLLYVQNYVSPVEECLGQSWYLSADMQMFWISPLILYPLYLWPTFGVIFLAGLTLLSTLWTFGIAYDNGFHAVMLQMTSMDQFSMDYVATHTRIMPWLVGIGLGFAICAIKARRISVRLSKTWVAVGWMASTGICLGCLYGFSSFQGDNPASLLDAAFYLAFTRPAWGIGLAWVVFACIYGYGGIVNSFLSLGIFQPLGKLSYNVYLIHMTLLVYRFGVMRNNIYISDFNMVYEFLATLVLSYLFAVVLHLLVEAPTAVIDRELLRNIKIFPYPKPQESKSAKIEELEKGENNSGFEETSEATASTATEQFH